MDGDTLNIPNPQAVEVVKFGASIVDRYNQLMHIQILTNLNDGKDLFKQGIDVQEKWIAKEMEERGYKKRRKINT